MYLNLQLWFYYLSLCISEKRISEHYCVSKVWKNDHLYLFLEHLEGPRSDVEPRLRHVFAKP